MKALKTIRVAVLSSTLLVGSVFSAAVVGAEPTPMNPVQYCRENNNTVPTPFGPFPLPSTPACVSFIANGGSLTGAGFEVRCKELREQIPAVFNMPVDIDYSTTPPTNNGGFGGKIGSCVNVLRGYHTGTLTHPE